MELWDEICGSALEEYLSRVVTVRRQMGSEYGAVQAEERALGDRHPWLKELYDCTRTRALTEEESGILSEYLCLQCRLNSLDLRAAYLCGCRDSAEYFQIPGSL